MDSVTRTFHVFVVIALVAGLPCITAAQEVPETLRIRLFERLAPHTAVVSGQQGAVHVFVGDTGDAIAHLGPTQDATLTTNGTDVRVELGDRSLVARALRLVPDEGTLLQLDVPNGDGASETRQYPGMVTVAVDDAAPQLALVNHVALEDYVASVVAREYGFDDLEGSKAMAVVARTYALRTLGALGDDYDHADHVLAQQYDGVGRLTSTALQATRETQGEVLTYNGTLIQAVYSASSGGHTANNEDVWKSKPLPYLRGKHDPYDTSPYAEWEAAIPRDRWLDILSREHDFEVEGFLIADRSPDGRVSTIELLRDGRSNPIITANDFRLLVNQHFGKNHLKSTFFDAERRGSRYVFEGKGFGHGVGLSQWSAREMARQGYTYREILDFYYTGVELQHLDTAALVTEAPPQPKEPEEKKQTRRIGW